MVTTQRWRSSPAIPYDKSMRIVFTDSVLDYDLETAYLAPLGGTQSAVCYLAESLAQIGHQVTLITRKAAPAMQRGVACTNFSQVTAGDLSRWAPDALVEIGRASCRERV